MDKSILFVGHCFYNTWYLSRELRLLGWNSDLINIDTEPKNQDFYHGHDIDFKSADLEFKLNTYLSSLYKYSIFHFSNKGGMYFVKDYQSPTKFRRLYFLLEWFIRVGLNGKTLYQQIDLLISLRLISSTESGGLELTRFGFWIYKNILGHWLFRRLGESWDIHLLKIVGKKIGYTNNGCLDGVLKSTFSQWKPFNTCSICKWNNHPEVCSDELNKKWGEFRNSLTDYQCLLGGNRADYNLDDIIFESPWFYCLDSSFWNPDIMIPSNYILPFSNDLVKIYHSVGDFESRTAASNINIKCTHIYLELVEKFKEEGLPVELIFFHSIPNKIIRYYQAQSDIVVDMLTFGFFGANIREAMMLGKPTICYIRPEWLEDMRQEIPDYVDELPVISATPETIEQILRDLIADKSKREEIGRRSLLLNGTDQKMQLNISISF
jgi:glycosyltransferase involved in cell wall biosynthesis